MPRIVLSYRREDTQAATRLLYDSLTAHYGPGSVFWDYDSVRSEGDDIGDRIDLAMSGCDVVLAVIGARWRGTRGGKNRLLDPDDWVRMEIETALKKNLRIIPLLIDNAEMPAATELPESIRNLRRRAGFQFSTARDFTKHLADLTRTLDRILFPPAEPAVDGSDIAVETSIRLEECVFGVERTVGLPDGSRVVVRIPAGTRDDEQVRMVAQGAAGQHGGKNGDLIVTVHLSDHPIFRRSGRGDLMTSLRIAQETAAQGGTAQVFTPTGPAEISVPPGSSSHTVLTLPGSGLPASASEPAGDLLVRLEIIPQAKPAPLRGDDILAQVGITLEECFSGTTEDVGLHDGDKTYGATVCIPPGATDGTTIRVAGQGKPGQYGGAPGDLLVSVRLLRHARFERDGRNLTVALDVPAGVAQRGGAVAVDLPVGELSLPIPAATSNNAVLPFKGLGLPHVDGAAGDLLARVRIVPDREIEDPPPPPPVPPRRRWPWILTTTVALGIAAALFVAPSIPGFYPTPPPPEPVVAPAVPAAPPASPALGQAVDNKPVAKPVAVLTDDENKAITHAEEAAGGAQKDSVEAATVETQAQQLANRIEAMRGETFTVERMWLPPTNTSLESITFKGFGSDSNAIPDGEGRYLWTTKRHGCVSTFDKEAPSRRYSGDFKNGVVAGFGVYHSCNGTVLWAHRVEGGSAGWGVARMPDQGSGISRMPDKAVYRGRFDFGVPETGGDPTRNVGSNANGGGIPTTGVMDLHAVSADRVAKEAGQFDSSGRLDGSGVRTCTNGWEWRGHWAHGAVSGYAALFDAGGVLKQHGRYGADGGEALSPDYLCKSL
jgi:DnaJ-class molecular chaperone